jgi:aldose 1-epimerase
MTESPDAPLAPPVLERIAAGDWVAEVAPEIGGSLASLYTPAGPRRPRRDWLRPAARAALQSRDPLGMASFPLVPWCNRIRDGRFEWEGRQVRLPPNADGSPHTIHGTGWRRPWQVTGRHAGVIDLELKEPASDSWPFAFQASQRYELDPSGLAITVGIRNTGVLPMPAGIGHHPYFAHRREGSGTTVQADVDAIWLSDSEVMPTSLVAGDSTVLALRSGMPLASFVLDNNFTGFRRRSQVTWPDGSSLVLAADEPLHFFVLYSPAQENFFVMEAVSNCTDWLNLRHRLDTNQTGGAVLAPGQSLFATTRFMPAWP